MILNPAKVLLSNCLFLGQEWTGIMRNASTPAANLVAALHTAFPGRSGTQATYVANYSNYANVNVPRTVSGFTVNQTTGNVTLAANVVFPRSASSGQETPQVLPYFSLGDAAGNVIQVGCMVLSGTTPKPFTALASTDTVSSIAHGANSGSRVAVFAVGNASLPGGLTEGAVYFARSDVAANTLTLATTLGGAAIDITSDGSGILYVLDPFSVGNNYEPTVNTSTAILID